MMVYAFVIKFTKSHNLWLRGLRQRQASLGTRLVGGQFLVAFRLHTTERSKKECG